MRYPKKWMPKPRVPEPREAKPMSAETRVKLSHALKGRVLTLEHKASIHASRTTRHPKGSPQWQMAYEKRLRFYQQRERILARLRSKQFVPEIPEKLNRNLQFDGILAEAIDEEIIVQRTFHVDRLIEVVEHGRLRADTMEQLARWAKVRV